MNCPEARQHWNLYHDSEGDAGLHFQIGEHLAVCPGCAQWFHQQSRLEDLLVQKIAVQQPTPELWTRVLAETGLVKLAPARRWILFGSLLACAASLLLAFLLFRQSGSGQDNSILAAGDLMAVTTTMHQRLVAGDEPLQFRSQSDLEVDDYLRRQVSFPVRCPPRKDAGFEVEGAGVCKMADQPAAYLAGRVDMTPVSIFVLPRESMARFPKQRAALEAAAKPHRCREGELEMVLGMIDRNAVLVVGQTQPERLERVLLAYGTYPDRH